LAVKSELLWVSVPPTPAKVSLRLTCAVEFEFDEGWLNVTPIVHWFPTFRVKPDTHCVPDEGVEIEKVLEFGPPPVFVTVGSAERVIAPLLLFVTVIVPDLGLIVDCPVELRAGTGPANNADTPPPPPPVVATALPVRVTVALGLAKVAGEETVTVNVADFVPGVVFMLGWNVTLITHERPACNVFGQADDCPY
jgi:hypothetical protein